MVSLALLLPLAGCTSKPEKEKSLTILSCEFPEDTNYYLGRAIAEFTLEHPDVKVDLICYDGSDTAQFLTKHFTEIMAGNGPDLIWFNPLIYQKINTVSDMEKMMRSGAFADMTSFMESDKDIDWEDANQAVLEAGRRNGKQYLLPIDYGFPLLITTQEQLDRYQIKKENLGGYQGFLREMAVYLDNAGEDDSSVFPQELLLPLCSALNDTFSDYEAGAVKEEFFALGEALETERRIAVFDQARRSEGENFLDMEEIAHRIADGEILFHDVTYSESSTVGQMIAALEAYGKTPVAIPMRNSHGELCAQFTNSFAITESSKNKQAAYQFISTLLTPPAQSGELFYRVNPNIPVLRSSLSDCFSRQKDAILKMELSLENTEKEVAYPDSFYAEYIGDIDEIDAAISYHTMADYRIFLSCKSYFLTPSATLEKLMAHVQERIPLYLSE